MIQEEKKNKGRNQKKFKMRIVDNADPPKYLIDDSDESGDDEANAPQETLSDDCKDCDQV